MYAWKMLLLLMLGSAVTQPALAATTTEPIRGPISHQVIIEGGLVWPGGDLENGFMQSPLGIDAGSGTELGFRYRYYFRSSLSISPSFHFVNFGPHVGEDPNLVEYEIQPTSFRYSLELLFHKMESTETVQPFLGVSAGLYRNRLTGLDKNLITEIDGSTNSLGLAVRGGIRRGDFEISAVYHRNRFDTWQFFWTGCCQSYSWDSISLRLGWSIP